MSVCPWGQKESCLGRHPIVAVHEHVFTHTTSHDTASAAAAAAEFDTDSNADIASDVDAAYEPDPCDDYDCDRNSMPAT